MSAIIGIRLMKPEESSVHGDFESGVRIASEVGTETEQFLGMEEEEVGTRTGGEIGRAHV